MSTAFTEEQLLLGILEEMKHARHGAEALELAHRNLSRDPQYYRFATSTKYSATPRKYSAKFEESEHPQPVRYAQARSPKPDGLTINGKHYPPGQFIPGHALAQATPMQKRQIASGISAKDPGQPRAATSKPQVQDVVSQQNWPWVTAAADLEAHLHAQGILRHAAIRSAGPRVIVTIPDKAEITFRVAAPGELEQAWKQNAVAALASASAGGFDPQHAVPAAMYRDGEIVLAPDFTDGEINHELVHGLEDLGLISAAEIAAFGGHEQTAYAYQQWVDAGRPTQTVFQRIAGFLRSLLGHRDDPRQAFFEKADSGALIKAAKREGIARRLFQDSLLTRGLGLDVSHLVPGNQPMGPGSVDPALPTSALRSNGTLNVAGIQFATREWSSWMDRALGNPLLLDMFGEDALQDLRHGMAFTHGIFGDYNLPEEYTRDPLTGKLVNPLRDNNDPLFEKTFDISTICPQQDVYVDAINDLQHRHNRVFNKMERFLIGQMLVEGGCIPTCWYCYGQASRNNGALTVLNGRQIWANVTAAYKSKKMGRLKESELKRLFRPDPQAPSNWSVNGQFAKYLQKHWNNPEAHHLWTNQLPRLHDIAMGYERPTTPTEHETKAALKTAMLTVNLPKGWASYDKQLLTKTSAAKIAKFNKSAGYRINSQTDFRPWHAIEMAQFLTHLGAKGGMAHAYTRKPEFLELFGDTGLKFNLSCSYAMGTDGKVLRDKDGSPMWDMSSFGQDGFAASGQLGSRWVNHPAQRTDATGRQTGGVWPSGMGIGKQKALVERIKNPNVGTMLVPTTTEALLLGLDDKHIDMIIPYHAGAVAKSIDRHQHADDFSNYQHEHWNTTGEKVNRGSVAKPKMKRVVLLPDGRKVIEGDDFQLAVGGKLLRFTAMGPITREHHEDNKAKYLEVCDTLGAIPRFPQLCGYAQRARDRRPPGKGQPNGPVHPMESINIDHPNYMRLVKDVARTDTPQQPVDPRKINWQGVNQHLEVYMKHRQGQSLQGKNKHFVDIISDRIANNQWPLPQVRITESSPNHDAPNAPRRSSQSTDPQATVARYAAVANHVFRGSRT